MGLFFTLLYVFGAYVAPQTIYGDAAQTHIQIFIACLTLLFTLFSLQESGLLGMPQMYAIAGLTFMVGCSIAFNGWLGGAPVVLLDFLPNSLPYFFVALNCKKKSHLQLLIFTLFVASSFVIYQSFQALQTGDYSSPYLLNQNVGDGVGIYRIRGLSFINDPNDLAQLLVWLVPGMFFFWNKGKIVRNVFFVLIPVAILLYGMFLTHSRGGMMALVVIVIVAARRKVGLLPSIVAGGLLFAGFSAVGWSGGRDVSASSGADRLDAWSTGLQLVRSHPIFGVGYKSFGDYNIVTAHNTVVVCAAELGLPGLFFLVMLILVTVFDAIRISDSGEKQVPEERTDAMLALAGGGAAGMERPLAGFAEARMRSAKLSGTGSNFFLEGMPGFEAKQPAQGLAGWEDEGEIAASEEEKREIRRMASIMLAACAGFFTAGWFLSRAYTMTLFINAGVVGAIYKMAVERGVITSGIAIGRAMKLSAITSVLLILVVYLILRTDHLLPQ